ncbi:MAG: hypothetical protein Q9214_005900 [Letrouitia sp. 1 TL-2023]
MLMHNKILYVRPMADRDAAYTGWAYIGSANCSESAWGKLVKDRQAKIPKLNCRNWECGVIVPIKKFFNIGSGKNLEEPFGSLSVFKQVGVPIPMDYPGQEYGKQKPWFFTK